MAEPEVGPPQVAQRFREWRHRQLGLDLGEALCLAFGLGPLELPLQPLQFCLSAVAGRIQMEVALGVDGQIFGERGVKDFSSVR
jgi:hypothetical protein